MDARRQLQGESDAVFGKFRMEDIEEPCIITGHHDTEADIFSVQALEGGAVAYHEPFFNAFLEYIIGGQAVPGNSDQNEVCVGRVCPAP